MSLWRHSLPGTRCYLPFAHTDPGSLTRSPCYHHSLFAINCHRFTFLATLFLLLFVSSAIILRSFVLRRRFRRRIEEAILAGVVAPHHVGRMSRRRAIGEKPKLWEARVSPAYDDGWHAIIVRVTVSSLFSSHPIYIISSPDSSPSPFLRLLLGVNFSVLAFDVYAVAFCLPKSDHWNGMFTWL